LLNVQSLKGSVDKSHRKNLTHILVRSWVSSTWWPCPDGQWPVVMTSKLAILADCPICKSQGYRHLVLLGVE
jgi:hypothetical protein